MNWRRFVARHGAGARARDLSHVLGVPLSQIEAARTAAAAGARAIRFPELFALWHGRAPRDDEWPAPRPAGRNAEYEWLGPEDALLATLVGQLDVPRIAATLTKRLRLITGDAGAKRSASAVLVRIHRIGLQTSDVLGGLTPTQAGRQIGGRHIVEHAIRTGKLGTIRRGRNRVIPHEEWAQFLAKRQAPPPGYVPLRKLRDALAQRSDKLQALAARGLVPTAVRCFPRGVASASSPNGIFYIDATVAAQLRADAAAGRPMPWARQPDIRNLKVTWKLYQQRRHPAGCQKCRDIWGNDGAPLTFADFAVRYPPLEHGAKRHLTFKWDPGHTVAELASRAQVPIHRVRVAIANGAVAASGEPARVTKSDAARWIARHCPTGEGPASWISREQAAREYGFSPSELEAFIADGRLLSRPGAAGAALQVCRQQCSDLRKARGYTLEEAAQRLGVTSQRAGELLRGLTWRVAERIPHDAVESARKRLESAEGFTLEEAALAVGRDLPWLEQQISAGVVRVSKPVWSERRYIAAPMLQRLRAAAAAPPCQPEPPPHWLAIGAAATLAGVSKGTVSAWAAAGLLTPMAGRNGARYDPEQLRLRARRYWRTARCKRPLLPDWLSAEHFGQAHG